MILILGVVFAFLGLEEVVAGDELEDSAGQAPHVRGLVVLAAEANLWGAVLSGLDDVRELVVDVAGVAHVDQLHSKLQRYYLFQILLI